MNVAETLLLLVIERKQVSVAMDEQPAQPFKADVADAVANRVTVFDGNACEQTPVLPVEQTIRQGRCLCCLIRCQVQLLTGLPAEVVLLSSCPTRPLDSWCH